MNKIVIGIWAVVIVHGLWAEWLIRRIKALTGKDR